MVFKKKNKRTFEKSKYSVISKFKSDGKLTDLDLNNINNISLEDLIAIKLELSTRYLCGKYYGMPLWRVTKLTVVDAMLKTALSISRTKKEAARFLGIDYNDFNKMLKKYETKSFFEDGGETVSTEEKEN